METRSEVILGEKLTLEDLERVAKFGATVSIAPSARKKVAASRETVERVVRAGDQAESVYGINTGFGALSETRISASDLAALQRNLILSHCCGVGDPLPENVVRLIMSLKLLSLGRGASGVRRKLVELIEGMIANGVIPVIPEKGSVGASGDLAPLAHMTSIMLGHGEATVAGKRLPGADALRSVGLEPIALEAKEGLALINGTQVSTALALAGLFRAKRALRAAIVTGALSTDAPMGPPAPFAEALHTLRGHAGQHRLVGVAGGAPAGAQAGHQQRAVR